VSEIISTNTNHNIDQVQNYITQETGYATPKIDVRGVVFKDDKILLVKEKVDNLWTPPGGWADVYESPGENVEREVFEESGFKVTAQKLLAVYDRSRHGHQPEYPHYIYKMFFLCNIIGGNSRTGIETSGVEFFGNDELPELSIARVTAKQIHRMFKLRDIDRTDFD